MRALRSLAAAVALAALFSAAPVRAEIAESKRALVLELLEISGGALAAEQLAQALLLQLEALYPAMVEQVMAEETRLEPEEQRLLRTHLSDFDRFAETFRTRFPERIDLGQILAQAYVPLYDRYFEEDELRAIVAFYRTPAGKKMLHVTPALMQEGIAATIPLVQPRVAELVGEILAEERGRVLR